MTAFARPRAMGVLKSAVSYPSTSPHAVFEAATKSYATIASDLAPDAVADELRVLVDTKRYTAILFRDKVLAVITYTGDERAPMVRLNPTMRSCITLPWRVGYGTRKRKR